MSMNIAAQASDVQLLVNEARSVSHARVPDRRAMT